MFVSWKILSHLTQLASTFILALSFSEQDPRSTQSEWDSHRPDGNGNPQDLQTGQHGQQRQNHQWKQWKPTVLRSEHIHTHLDNKEQCKIWPCHRQAPIAFCVWLQMLSRIIFLILMFMIPVYVLMMVMMSYTDSLVCACVYIFRGVRLETACHDAGFGLVPRCQLSYEQRDIRGIKRACSRAPLMSVIWSSLSSGPWVFLPLREEREKL